MCDAMLKVLWIAKRLHEPKPTNQISFCWRLAADSRTLLATKDVAGDSLTFSDPTIASKSIRDSDFVGRSRLTGVEK